jgi:hypothetical protein
VNVFYSLVTHHNCPSPVCSGCQLFGTCKVTCCSCRRGEAEGCCDTGRKSKWEVVVGYNRRITVLVRWNKGKCLCFGRRRLIFSWDNFYCVASLYKTLLVYVAILVLIVFCSVVLIKLISRHKGSVKPCFTIRTSDLAFIVIWNLIYQPVLVLPLFPLTR